LLLSEKQGFGSSILPYATIMKTFIKKFKIFNFIFEVFISVSENIFLKISTISKLLLNLKIIRRLAFNLQPRNKYILLSTNYGMYVINTNSRVIGKKSYINNIPYSANSVKKVFDTLTKENIFFDYFIDIGANIGTSSISASFINEKIKFLCIEGSDENFYLLKKNVIINNLESRFELHNSLIGNKDNLRIFVEFKEEKGCSSIFENHEELERYKREFGYEVDSIKEVKTQKIEDILKIDFNKKLFFWIDIEGLDLEIINSEITKNKHPVFFEFNPTFYKLKLINYQNYLEKLEIKLMEYGYEYYFLEVNKFKKEKIMKGFLTHTSALLGENKSATNILLI
jgi:FkbM family methyltransferase